MYEAQASPLSKTAYTHVPATGSATTWVMPDGGSGTGGASVGRTCAAVAGGGTHAGPRAESGP
eukprot:105999-Chlamydomonas_euryale.AAC.1